MPAPIMMDRWMTRLCGATVIALLALGGCTTHPHVGAPEQAIQPVPTSGSGNIIALQLGPQTPGGPRDPQPKVPLVYRLEAYVISVPFGTVSRNETFWKRINEQCVDVATYDVLYKNGLRIGQAPYQEWEYIRGLIAQHPGTASKMATIGGDAKNVEL